MSDSGRTMRDHCGICDVWYGDWEDGKHMEAAHRRIAELEGENAELRRQRDARDRQNTLLSDAIDAYRNRAHIAELRAERAERERDAAQEGHNLVVAELQRIQTTYGIKCVGGEPSVGQGILTGLKQAIAWARGEDNGCRVTEYVAKCPYCHGEPDCGCWCHKGGEPTRNFRVLQDRERSAKLAEAMEQGGCMGDRAPGEYEAWMALSPEEQKTQAAKNLAELCQNADSEAQEPHQRVADAGDTRECDCAQKCARKDEGATGEDKSQL